MRDDGDVDGALMCAKIEQNHQQWSTCESKLITKAAKGEANAEKEGRMVSGKGDWWSQSGNWKYEERNDF